MHDASLLDMAEFRMQYETKTSQFSKGIQQE